MPDEVSPGEDLFGNPFAEPVEKRGRKAHVWDRKIAENVGVLRATGHTVEQIADLVNVSEPTLRKYYFRALEQGADIVEALLDRFLFDKAAAGSVPANRALRERLAKGKAAIPIGPEKAAEPRPAKAPKLGKKEQATVDAHVAHEGTGWADLLAPAKPN